MARSYGYYEAKKKKGSEPAVQLCFACAVRLAVADGNVLINFDSDDYESHKCEFCGRFIDDRINI